MKTFTIKDIRGWNPCYDPIRHLPEDWKGNILDILNNDKIPFQDRLWVIFRTDLVSDKLMRLFAVWSYRQTLTLVKNPDPRSIAAANAAEQFAEGHITQDELVVAKLAAVGAAEAAQGRQEAALWAAESAVWTAAAAPKATTAAWAAAWAAGWAAESWAAGRAAQSAQCNKLKEMLIAGVDTGDVK